MIRRHPTFEEEMGGRSVRSANIIIKKHCILLENVLATKKIILIIHKKPRFPSIF